MTGAFDIAIIGGGVIGLSLARALAAYDVRIALIDAGARVPPATSAAAGMLAPSFENKRRGGELNDRLYHFGARALSMWPDYAASIEAETGVNVDFRGHGVLGVAFSDAQSVELKDQAALVSSFGGKASLISGEEARDLEPALSKEIVAALWAPQDAQVDPRRLLVALRAATTTKNIWRFEETVTKLDVDERAVDITVKSGAKFQARKAVLAGGAVSGLTSRKLVFPVKGDAVSVNIGEGVLTRVVRAPGAYLCPKAGGRLVIGASEEYGRDDLNVEPQAIDRLKSNAVRAAPVVKSAKELERWSGLRPGTPDGAPILGRADNGLFLAMGHYRNGVLHAPASAADMAALMLSGEINADLESFTAARFADAA